MFIYIKFFIHFFFRNMDTIHSQLANRKKKSLLEQGCKSKKKRNCHRSLSKLDKIQTNRSLLNSQQNQPGRSALEALRQLEDPFDDRKQVWQQHGPLYEDFRSLSLVNKQPLKSETKLPKQSSIYLHSPIKLKTQPNQKLYSQKFSPIQIKSKIKSIKDRGYLTVKNVQICQLKPNKLDGKTIKVKRSFNISIKKSVPRQKQNISISHYYDSCKSKQSVQLKNFQFSTLSKNHSFSLKKSQHQLSDRNKALENAKIKLSKNLLHNTQAQTLIEFIRKANQESQIKVTQLNKQRQKKQPIFIFKYQH